MKWLRDLFGPKGIRLDLRLVTYGDANKMLIEGWQLAPEEDNNRRIGYVWLEKRSTSNPLGEPK